MISPAAHYHPSTVIRVHEPDVSEVRICIIHCFHFLCGHEKLFYECLLDCAAVRHGVRFLYGHYSLSQQSAAVTRLAGKVVWYKGCSLTGLLVCAAFPGGQTKAQTDEDEAGDIKGMMWRTYSHEKEP